MEVELLLAGIARPVEGIEQEDVMIARWEPLEDASREPVPALLENGRALGAGSPRAALELVEVVTRVLTE
jgi:hypothetical protein